MTRTALVLALVIVASLSLYAEKVAVKAPPREPAEPSPGVTEVDASSEVVEIDKQVKEGHITIVDVFSEACPPCRRLSPKLDELTRKRADIKVLKVNIGVIEMGDKIAINWKSPTAVQYNIQSIPYLMLYDEKAQKTSEGDAAFEEVLQWLKAEKIVD